MALRLFTLPSMTLTRRDWLTRSLTAGAALGLALHDWSFSPLSGSLAAATLRQQVNDLTPGDVCTLTCAQTLGPCHYDPDLVRHDITEGKGGLPTLLSFLIVDADTCQPIENATVEVWHTDPNGVYSAPISTMCNPGNALARTQTFLRGIQTTGADGFAYFSSVFP